ncbi:MAG: heat-inducible transcriptional repressor HrcA [Hyphomicrobiales bacterium]
MENTLTGLAELDRRSRNIFKQIVESYLHTGEPVGSRTVSRALPMNLSPASIRNVMSDLEEIGLIFSPHTSAGRMPTEFGLRLFVDGLLELGDLTKTERTEIEARIAARNAEQSIEDVLTEATNLLSGLSQCAGVVLTPKRNVRLKHIEFVSLEPSRALAVMVGDDGMVENRIVELPAGLPPSTLTSASNYLNVRMQGKTLDEIQHAVQAEVENRKTALDKLTAKVVEAGLATWAGADEAEHKTLIVRGRSNLLEDVTALEDLERVRQLFDDLENKKDLIHLLGLAERAEGVKIFIGSENKLFSMSGSSLIVSPYRDTTQKVVGVIGVIGPTRVNYARIVPMVDYTARMVGRLLT